jgi:hypothetical protein
MLKPIVALVLMIVGFVVGYGLRASISRKRRALAREEWLRRRDQKRYDEGVEINSPFTASDEALEAAANAGQLAAFSLGNCTDARLCQVPN